MFVESKKRVIKAYGKLFWLKLFMQGFIRLDNVDKSLISRLFRVKIKRSYL